MRELKDEFFEFLDKQKELTTEAARKLLQEERKDESNTLKAKANIYDIFKSIWSAAESTTNTEEDFRNTFLTKIEIITSPWAKSLETAKQYGDVSKIVIEEAKLAAVNEVKEQINTFV